MRNQKCKKMWMGLIKGRLLDLVQAEVNEDLNEWLKDGNKLSYLDLKNIGKRPYKDFVMDAMVSESLEL